MTADRRSWRLLLGALALLVAAAFAALGVWQAGRATQKARWIDAFEQALVAPPQPLARAIDDLAAVPQRVSGRVAFAPSLPWLLLDNQRRGAAVGVRAYRIGRIDGAATEVLVDFGWLPLDAERRWPALPTPAAQIDATGLLAPPPSAGLRLAAAPPDTDRDAPQLLLYIDPVELSERFDVTLAPRVLRLDPADAGPFQRDLVALPNTLPPEQHRGYAVQWFGLAATVLIVTGLLLYRSRQR